MEAQPAIEERAETYWFIEPGYSIAHFTVKNYFFFTVRGEFAEVAGTIVYDQTDIRRSSVTATIKAENINTHSKRRDTHLRSADFLSADTYPEISFCSTSVQKGRDRDTLDVTGMLTIKNTSREVKLLVTEVDRSRSPQGEEIAYYTAVAEIDRHDFGVSHMRGLIGSKVKITIHIQAQKQGSIRIS